jgi:hypothetical protein
MQIAFKVFNNFAINKIINIIFTIKFIMNNKLWKIKKHSL